MSLMDIKVGLFVGTVLIAAAVKDPDREKAAKGAKENKS